MGKLMSKEQFRKIMIENGSPYITSKIYNFTASNQYKTIEQKKLPYITSKIYMKSKM